MYIPKIDKKVLLKRILLVLLFSLVPIGLGFLFGLIFSRKVIVESIPALFAVVYFFLVVIRFARKDNLLYRKNKYPSKEDYKQSNDYKKYIVGQIILLISALLLVLSSLLLFFFYVK